MTEVAPNPSAMASWTDTVYNLNRGDLDVELERLVNNHFNLWSPLTGDLLPPHILKSLQGQESPRIADVATGNGVWLTSLAEHLPPRSELYGFDFDRLKFPSQQPEKPRIDFQEQNVLEPFPEEMRGTFDLVHVRLLALGLKAVDWDVAVGNLFGLLKPGGWLTWEDTGDLFIRAFPLSSAYEEYWWARMKHDVRIGRDNLMPAALLKKLQKLGFQNCEQKVWSTWAADKAIQDITTAACFCLVKPSLAAIVEDGGEETIRTMEDAIRVERTLAMEVEQKTIQIGLHCFRNWGQRPW